jgi:hypothetical protein
VRRRRARRGLRGYAAPATLIASFFLLLSGCTGGAGARPSATPGDVSKIAPAPGLELCADSQSLARSGGICWEGRADPATVAGQLRRSIKGATATCVELKQETLCLLVARLTGSELRLYIRPWPHPSSPTVQVVGGVGDQADLVLPLPNEGSPVPVGG